MRAHVLAHRVGDAVLVVHLFDLVGHRGGMVAPDPRDARTSRAPPLGLLGVEPADLLAIAMETAEAAGRLLLERFHGPARGVARKSSSTDMVSDADRDAEELIRNRLRGVRQYDAIIGEEGGSEAGSSGLRWVIDPLDGTTNFLFGVPQWAVSIGCEDAEGGLVGVVHSPCHGEMFAAMRGGGAFMGDERLAVSEKSDLADALVVTGFSYLPEERAAEAAVVARVLPRVRDVRRPGAASLDIAWTAAGRFDAYYEVPTHHWDWAGGVVIAREAGAVVSELAPVGPSGPGLVVAGPGIHDALRALVAG
jgi:myo-inositol-1(or 4)-monophosphatase